MINDDGLSAFLTVRARLYRIAYRMLGSAAAAEDIVQEVWIRWQSTNRCAVRNSTAFLATTANRLAINVRQAAHSRRETWVAPGLPEPVDTDSDQALRVERADALTLGAFLLLGRLSSAERAAYILREAFDYAYGDIADALDVQEANARQLVSRARLHLAQGPKTSVLAEDHRRLLATLSAATQTEDARGLIEQFAAETRRHERGRKNRTTTWDSSQAPLHGGTEAAHFRDKCVGAQPRLATTIGQRASRLAAHVSEQRPAVAPVATNTQHFRPV